MIFWATQVGSWNKGVLVRSAQKEIRSRGCTLLTSYSPVVQHFMRCFQKWKINWIAWTRRYFNPVDLSFWTAEVPSCGCSHGVEMCREALTHSQTTSAPIKGLSPHFHLMFQKKDEGIRKGGSLVLRHDRVDQAVIQEGKKLKMLSSCQMLTHTLI